MFCVVPESANMAIIAVFGKEQEPRGGRRCMIFASHNIQQALETGLTRKPFSNHGMVVKVD